MKNVFGKSRKPGNAYLVVNGANGWSWEILKLYKSVESSRKDPYARAFCLVRSPFVGPSGEYGDVYLKDIPGGEIGNTSLFRDLEAVELKLKEVA